MALKDKLMTLEDFKAVRDVDVASNSAQFMEIKADLGDVEGTLEGIKTKVVSHTLSKAGRFTVNVNSVIGETVVNPNNPESSSTWHHIVLSCANVDHFKVTATGGMSFRPYFFLDSNNVLLAYAPNSTYDGDVALVENASKLVVQASSESSSVVVYGIEGELDTVRNDVDGLLVQTEEGFIRSKNYSCGYETDYEKSQNPSIFTDLMDNAIKSIVLYGESTGLVGYDKMYVLDGSENWRESSSFANSFRGPNVLAGDLANNYSPGVVDGYIVQTQGNTKVNSIRLGPEITVINTKFATVEAFKAHLAENPVRIWYRSDNYVETDPQYYACSIACGDGNDVTYPAIGIIEKINPLESGDILDFINGALIRNDDTTDMLTTNRTAYGINGVLTLSSQGDISVRYARNLSNKLQSISGLETPMPMITIIDDDGHHGFYNLVLPLIKSKHVPIASAVVTNRANGDTESSSWMDWSEIIECYENGAEILCHNFTHMSAETASGLSVEEMQWNYQKAKNQLREHGITSDIFVYNGATGDMTQCIEAAKRVFRGAIKSGGNITNFTSHGDRWGIRRYPCDDRLSDVNELYALVDKVKSTGGWMIWMVHTSDTLTANTIGNLELAIDYARSQGVAIVTAECGFDYYVDRFWGR